MNGFLRRMGALIKKEFLQPPAIPVPFCWGLSFPLR